MTQTDSVATHLPTHSVSADSLALPAVISVPADSRPLPVRKAISADSLHQVSPSSAAAPAASRRPAATYPAATPSASSSHIPYPNLAPAAAPMPGYTPLFTLTPDSLKQTPDSTKRGDTVFGVVMDAPVMPHVESHPPYNFGMSYILAGLFLLFALIGLRFRNNSKYITALLHNLVDVRERSNVFDETVRETSFIVLLNLLWSCSAGMVLCALLDYSLPGVPGLTTVTEALSLHPALCTAVCMGIMVVYTCVMALTYLTVGSVFYDAMHAKMWVKGFLASQGLVSILFFPLALLLLYYPQWYQPLLWTALGSFLIAKIVFIWKGFRIFFTQFSSWVLFLYYLCSLEIVPLILTYWAACRLCSLL